MRPRIKHCRHLASAASRSRAPCETRRGCVGDPSEIRACAADPAALTSPRHLHVISTSSPPQLCVSSTQPHALCHSAHVVTQPLAYTSTSTRNRSQKGSASSRDGAEMARDGAEMAPRWRRDRAVCFAAAGKAQRCVPSVSKRESDSGTVAAEHSGDCEEGRVRVLGLVRSGKWG